jgi:hypothetical protein
VSRDAFEVDLGTDLGTERENPAALGPAARVVEHWRASFSLRFVDRDWAKIVAGTLSQGPSVAELCATIDAAKTSGNERARWLRSDPARMTLGMVLGTVQRVLMLGAIAPTPKRASGPTVAKAPAAPRLTTEEIERAKVKLGFMRATDFVQLPELPAIDVDLSSL